LFAGRVDRFDHDEVAADLVEADQLLEVTAGVDIGFLVIDQHGRPRVGGSFDHVEGSAERVGELELQ
jgi:hypothetical protein